MDIYHLCVMSSHKQDMVKSAKLGKVWFDTDTILILLLCNFNFLTFSTLCMHFN
jgi:hypothetical protein